MIKRHLIFVPKNEEGVRDYENGVESNDNFFVYDVPEDEFGILWKHHVFEMINRKYHLLIDECEEETVTAEQLKEMYPAISIKKGVWLEAVDKAIKLGTCAYLHF